MLTVAAPVHAFNFMYKTILLLKAMKRFTYLADNLFRFNMLLEFFSLTFIQNDEAIFFIDTNKNRLNYIIHSLYFYEP